MGPYNVVSSGLLPARLACFAFGFLLQCPPFGFILFLKDFSFCLKAVWKMLLKITLVNN